MDFFDIAAVLVSLSAAFAYLNKRFIKLPTAIGLMLISLLFSLGLIVLGQVSPEFQKIAKGLVASVDFEKTVLEGMLSFLLFAGALHVNFGDLMKHKWMILLLAAPGTLLSTAIVGTAMYFVFGLFGIEISFIYCLLFGALISPTDPIAVLGLLKSLGVPKALQTKITGESLINDGIAVVLFVGLMGMVTGKRELYPGDFFELFLIEAGGGILLGLILGYAGYRLCKTIDDYAVEVLLTLAVVMGGYSLALQLHTSGPLAMVVAGLFIGNRGRQFAMTEATRERLDGFWEMLDEILNAVLFVLIGLEVLLISLDEIYLELGLIAIPIVLLARLIAVSLPVTGLRLSREFPPNTIKILTWGGLRGGISVALALALPVGPERSVILTATYVVVTFSIIVQGLTIQFLVPKEDSVNDKEEEGGAAPEREG